MIESVSACRKQLQFTVSYPNSTLQSRLLAKILKDGLPSASAHNVKHFVDRQRTDVMNDFFGVFMTKNDMNFNMQSTAGYLHFSVDIPEETKLDRTFTALVDALDGVALTEDKFNMKKLGVAGEIGSVKHDSRGLSRAKMTQLLFDEGDLNYEKEPERVIEQLATVDSASVEKFYSNFMNDLPPLYVTAVVPAGTEEKSVAGAINKLHYDLGNNRTESFEMPLMPSSGQSQSKSTTKAVIKGKQDVVVSLGIRLPFDRNDDDYTTVRVLADILGGGMNSLLNNRLRKELGWSYGVYARLEGGNHGSDSWLHMCGTYAKKHLANAKKEMKQIVDKFFSAGPTRE